MNFFQYDKSEQAKTARIVMTKDIWIFVSFWLGLTLVTGAIFLYTYLHSRPGQKHDRSSKSINDKSLDEAIVKIA